MHTLTRRLPPLYNATAEANISWFRGVMIDMGAAHKSSGNLAQCLAYRNHIGCLPKIDATAETTNHFGNGYETSQNTALISFPVGAITVTFAPNILQEANVPLLMNIDKMDIWGLCCSNLFGRLIHSETGQFAQFIRDCTTPVNIMEPLYRVSLHYIKTKTPTLSFRSPRYWQTHEPAEKSWSWRRSRKNA